MMRNLLVIILTIIAGLSHAQNIGMNDISTTGNLVNWSTTPTATTSTWINGVYQQQLSCWYYTDPGNCGPNPTVTPGAINFSYGYTDLHQIVNIATALPNTGTGLRVNGYTFGFTAKNGNGWDNGQQDYLAAYVKLYDAAGNLTENYDYSLWTNRQYNWKNFYFNETFKTPYASKDLSTAQYGFIGYDTNYWAGTYGPEIINVNFSLKYSVDPCATNVLSSPSCPGYLDALNKLLPQSPVSTNTVTNTTTTPTATITTSVTDDPTNPTVTVTNTPLTTTTQITSEKSSAGGGNTSLGLSVIAKNQQREQNIVSQTVQNAATAATSAASTSQQESLSIAAMAVANSTSSSETGTSVSSSFGLKLSAGTQIGFSMQSSDTAMSNETSVTSYKNSLTDRSNPLNEYIEHKPNFSSGAMTTGPSVNSNVGNNEIAGGVDLSKIALAPAGYNDYLNLALRDASFYAPKEVYKNQNNVDNTRALRQLSSDAAHRELVELQYAK